MYNLRRATLKKRGGARIKERLVGTADKVNDVHEQFLNALADYTSKLRANPAVLAGDKDKEFDEILQGTLGALKKTIEDKKGSSILPSSTKRHANTAKLLDEVIAHEKLVYTAQDRLKDGAGTRVSKQVTPVLKMLGGDVTEAFNSFGYGVGIDPAISLIAEKEAKKVEKLLPSVQDDVKAFQEAKTTTEVGQIVQRTTKQSQGLATGATRLAALSAILAGGSGMRPSILKVQRDALVGTPNLQQMTMYGIEESKEWDSLVKQVTESVGDLCLSGTSCFLAKKGMLLGQNTNIPSESFTVNTQSIKTAAARKSANIAKQAKIQARAQAQQDQAKQDQAKQDQAKQQKQDQAQAPGNRAKLRQALVAAKTAKAMKPASALAGVAAAPVAAVASTAGDLAKGATSITSTAEGAATGKVDPVTAASKVATTGAKMAVEAQPEVVEAKATKATTDAVASAVKEKAGEEGIEMAEKPSKPASPAPTPVPQPVADNAPPGDVELTSPSKADSCPKGMSWLAASKHALYTQNEANEEVVALCPYVAGESSSAFSVNKMYGNGYCGWYAILSVLQTMRNSGQYESYFKTIGEKTPGLLEAIGDSDCATKEDGSTMCSITSVKAFMTLIREVKGSGSGTSMYMKDDDVQHIAERLNLTIAVTGNRADMNGKWWYFSPVPTFTKVQGIVSIKPAEEGAIPPSPIALLYSSKPDQPNKDHWDVLYVKEGSAAYLLQPRADFEDEDESKLGQILEAKPEAPMKPPAAEDVAEDKPVGGEEAGKMTPPTAADVETGDKSVGGEETGKMTPPTATDVSTEQIPKEDNPAEAEAPVEEAQPPKVETEAQTEETPAADKGESTDADKPADKAEAPEADKASGEGQAAIQVKSKDGAVKTSTITKNTDQGMEVTIKVMIPPGAQHIVTGDAGDSTTATLKGMATAINQGGGTRKHNRHSNKKTRRLH